METGLQATNNAIMESMSVNDVLRQVNLIQDVMGKVMVKDEHFGTIPGCKKPCLYKSGAEKLCMVFRLRAITKPDIDIKVSELGNGHREYQATVHLIAASGEEIATGIGSCSTMETKYRYRNSDEFEVTDLPIPKDAKDNKRKYRAEGYGMKQVDGQWVWVKYGSGIKIENPDPADMYNTCLKMAHKRAHVAGTILATACSDIFAQEDIPAPTDEPKHEPIKPPQEKPVTGATIISKAQGKLIWSRAKDAGLSEDGLRTIVAKHGFDSLTKITADKLDAILEDIATPPAKTDSDEDLPYN